MRKRRSPGVSPLASILVVSAGIGLVVMAAHAGASGPDTAVICPGQLTAASSATVDGQSLSATQAENARLIYDTAAGRRLPRRAAVIGIATAMQESRLRNVPYGTEDSLGLFQQRPSRGWGRPGQVMTPLYAATAFYDRLVRVPGWQSLPLTVAAQDVQRSAYPNAYARWEPLADSLADAFGDCASGLRSRGGRR